MRKYVQNVVSQAEQAPALLRITVQTIDKGAADIRHGDVFSMPDIIGYRERMI